MSRVETLGILDRDYETLSVSDMVDLLDKITHELSICAGIKPTDKTSRETDIRENALLNFEANLLDQAANVKMHSERDAQDLMKVWAKAAGIDAGQTPTPSDRIVMRVFRYISEALLDKD